MPGLGGFELLARIKELRSTLPILVLSMHNEGPVANRALQAGASGYITKDSAPETLVTAVREIARGGKFIDPVLVDRIVFDVQHGDWRAPHETLSERERQVFLMMISGMSLIDIATKLALSDKTVSTYKARIRLKLKVDNLVGLIRYAVEHRLTDF
jgi:DNA-binding NarL/FixJ family response regulator